MKRFSTPAGTPGFQLISTLNHLCENRSVGIRNETRMVGESLTFAQMAVASGRRPVDQLLVANAAA